MLSEIVASGELGEILYCSSQRLNLGAIRTDTSAMWDLAPHDISILLHLFGGLPDAVSAQQFSLLGERREDIAMITMNFRSGPVGHVQVSRLDPRKVRELTIVGDRKMAVYDDTNGEMPIRIYDKGVAVHGDDSRDLHHADFARHNLDVRSGDIVAPLVGGREPLRVEIEDFAHAVATGEQPVSSAHVGRDVVAVLEAAEHSAQLGGEPVFSFEQGEERRSA
jgi:predicted dehydrogenase